MMPSSRLLDKERKSFIQRHPWRHMWPASVFAEAMLIKEVELPPILKRLFGPNLFDNAEVARLFNMKQLYFLSGEMRA